MDTKGQLEKVLQYLLNEEEDKAVDLLKKVFIQKGRSINEQIMAEEQDVVEKILDNAGCEEDVDESHPEEDIRTMQGQVKSEEYFGEDADENTDGDELDGVLTDAQNSLAHLQQLFDEIHEKLSGEETEDGDEAQGDDSDTAELEVDVKDNGDDKDENVKESDTLLSDEEDPLDESELLEFSILDESVTDELPVVKLPANKSDFAGAKTGETEKLNVNNTSPVGKKTPASAAVIKKPTETIPAVGEKQDGVKVANSGVKSNFVRKSATDNTKTVK